VWARWAETLKKDPSAENYARAYDEVNRFLREQGDPARNRSADGTIYGETGSALDWEKGIIVALAGAPGKRVLDIGCGDGRLALALARRGASVQGIDISAIAIEAARQLAVAENCGPVSFAVGNAIDLHEPDAAFDYAACTDVVEHLNPDHVLPHMRQVHRVLKPGGAYIVSIPKSVPSGEVDPLHLGNYEPREFAALLTQAGFEPLRAPDVFYERSGRLDEILGRPRTWKAKCVRSLTRLPVIGALVAKRLLDRWCGSLNFFYARKPL